MNRSWLFAAVSLLASPVFAATFTVTNTSCGGGNYCPLTSANRGQMAAFLVKTFGLQ